MKYIASVLSALAVSATTLFAQGVAMRATNGIAVAPTILSNAVVLLKASNPYSQVPYPNPGAARASAVSGDTIVLNPGSYTVTNLAKDGVNWHFTPGVILHHDFNAANVQKQAIFQDNDYTDLNQYGDGTNSMSFKVTGTVIATNLPSAFAAFSGVKTKVDFDLPGSEITISNGATFVGMIPGCVVIQLPDLYTFPANKPAMDTRVNFKAAKVTGLIYLSDCAATWDVDLYENCAWWLDRDTTNSIYPSSVFKGREARNCNIVAGGAQATGHANGQIAVYEIPLWYGGDPLNLNTNIAHVNMGTVIFHGTRFYQGTNATSGLFWLSTGGTSASIDFTNAGWIVFNDCKVIGSAGNTKQLVGEDNGESHTNKGRVYIHGELAYVNASITGMPTNNGPGQLIEVFGLTNNSSGFTGTRTFPGTVVGTFSGNGSGLTGLTFGGTTTVSNLTVTGTLLAGNWASAMNPGTFSLYNVRSDTGTSAGTVTEASITANGALPWLGLQGTMDETGTQTGKVVNVYFPMTTPTNYNAGNFVPVTGKIKWCYSNYVIYAVTPTKTNLISDLR